ncbi:conjugal transfer protein TraQ [Chitinophaga caeni]|uniref:Conjugal transfer protein TraQ n=1 Tax=Chitinophaga caeni TaxID=2029983 RepID=A0A291QYE4_9BACT|nr:DUF3872 domain-containing protein [Chitinophaga caeni]ATL48941.1 conjugal transfer protein TraQ [Chitinophaga caeni]
MKIAISNLNLGQQLLYCFVLVALLSVILASCRKKELDIQQNFPFEVEVMPVPSEIALGETAELRCTILPSGDYNGTRYTIRYFQYEGKGMLRYFNDDPYLPNDRYPLPEREFRLYYTSASKETHSFTVWISDNFGNEEEISFQFNSSD